MDTKYAYSIISCADMDDARVMIDALLQAKLAPCVQAYPTKSFYVWEEKIWTDVEEIILKVLCKREDFERIKTTVVEVSKANNLKNVEPEVNLIPIMDGAQSYLDWIDEVTSSTYTVTGTTRRIL